MVPHILATGGLWLAAAYVLMTGDPTRVFLTQRGGRIVSPEEASETLFFLGTAVLLFGVGKAYPRVFMHFLSGAVIGLAVGATCMPSPEMTAPSSLPNSFYIGVGAIICGLLAGLFGAQFGKTIANWFGR